MSELIHRSAFEHNRADTDKFRELLRERDRRRDDYERLDEYRDEVKKELEVEELRGLNNELREAYFNMLVAKQNLEDYKNETASLYSGLPEWTVDEADRPEHSERELGDLEYLGEYESNSIEWLKLRQLGIGGSDIGPILKVGEKKYAYDAYREAIASKLDEPEVKEIKDRKYEVQGPIERGNFWEPIIANHFAKTFGNFKTTFSKATWRSKNDESMVVNVDGILTSEGEDTPDGFLEIKTSSRAQDWIDGVPPNYKAQVLWYMKAAGFDYAIVAVVIDDHEFRAYVVRRDDSITDYGLTIDLAQNRIDQFKRDVAKEKLKREKGFSNVNNSRINPEIAPKQTAANGVKILADLSGRSEGEIINEIASQEVSSESYEDAVKQVLSGIATEDDTVRLFIDLETTGFSDAKNEIIEFGWSLRDSSNKVLDEGNFLCSADPRFMRVNGSGADDVHGISVEDIEDEPMFSDSVYKLPDEIYDHNIPIVAHHATFERIFLYQNIDGFALAQREFLDTEVLCKLFEEGTENNRLQSFVERNGGEYVNAHRALEDANMMADAFHVFMSKWAEKAV